MPVASTSIPESYCEVVRHPGDLHQHVARGNMPPDNPWQEDWVGSFSNWINNGYARSAPPVARASTQFTARRPLPLAFRATRVRKDVTTLADDELALLKKAFTAVMERDPGDPDSYFAQAGLQWYPASNTYCMQHVPGFNPWHRPYLLSFENALRSVPGCDSVTLPYWDITTAFPETLKATPFDQYVLQADAASPDYRKGHVSRRFPYDQIAEMLLAHDVTQDIHRAMSRTNREDFHGRWSDALHNTIISVHDGSHNSIGPTMQDRSAAAFDPVFWFVHCNLDRLYWEWQKRMGGTDLHGLVSYAPSGAPWSMCV